MNNLLQAFEKIINIIIRHPLRTVFIIFTTMITIAISSATFRELDLIVSAFWILIVGSIIFIPWDSM